MVKTEQMFSRSTLMVFLWLSFFVLQSDSSGFVTVKANVGEEAKLPCSSNMFVSTSLESYFIYWQKPVKTGEQDLIVIAYAKGKEETNRSEPYWNRTKMDAQTLTLSIFPVKVSDEGKYRCLIIKDTTHEVVVHLSVVANFSKPVISPKTTPNACGPIQLTLTCSSHGGYPEPKMLGSINNTEVKWDANLTVDNQTELFNVTGQMQLRVTENISVQCSVMYANLQESSTFTMSKPKECPLPPSLPQEIIIVSSVILVLLVAVLTVVLLRYSCKCMRSTTASSSFQPVTTIDLTPQQQLDGKSEAVSF